MVTITLSGPLRRLVERVRQIRGDRQDFVTERQSRAHLRRFLRSRRQAANEATLAAPVVEEELVIDDEPVNDVGSIIGDEPPPYFPLRPPPYRYAVLYPPPPYSVASRDAGLTSTVMVDDEGSLAETNSINHQDGNNDVPEEPCPADVPTKRDRVD
jgi:hypothetical protein